MSSLQEPPVKKIRQVSPDRSSKFALSFDVKATSHRYARASTLHLPHGPVLTPVFMPVGTQATIKGLTPDQMEETSCRLLLANTYHLALRPGTKLLDRYDDQIHDFMNWKHNVLTDSGGFQMVSLSKLAEITEEGVKFQSFVDGSEMLLTPEASITHQNEIGADIIMALDDVVSSVSPDQERFIEATGRTVRWLDRCLSAHKRPEKQNLFAIVQGGLDVSDGGLRDQCLDAFLERNDQIPGFAIGGLAGGESKDAFWRVVAKCTQRLPKDKPRYLMGVGYPLDLVICSALGVDMFDCVFPTRTARFGTALVSSGMLKLKSANMQSDLSPIEEGCQCLVCRNYSRAYVHTNLKQGPDGIGAQLLTIHNVTYVLQLMSRLRQSILDDKFESFVRSFMQRQFPSGDYPSWTIDALSEAGIHM